MKRQADRSAVRFAEALCTFLDEFWNSLTRAGETVTNAGLRRGVSSLYTQPPAV